MKNFHDQPHFTSFLGQSILFHCALLSLAVINIYFFKKEEVKYISTIRVDVVALPDKTTPRPTPIISRKKTPPKIETKKPQVQPQPRPRPQVQLKKTKALPQAQKTQGVTTPSVVYDKKLQDVGQKAIDRLRHIEKVQGMVKKETIIKGNRIAPGTALEGLDKLDYDNYIGILHNHIQSYWELPQWLAVSDNLSTVVKVYLDANGYVINRELMRSSGDTRFDQIVLTAIDKASPFPKPEEKFIDMVYSGIILTAKP